MRPTPFQAERVNSRPHCSGFIFHLRAASCFLPRRLNVGRTTKVPTMPASTTLQHEHTALVDSRFVDVDLQRTVFQDVNLRGSVFRNVAFTGARLQNVCLGDVDIGDANIEGMKINGILVSELLRVYAQVHSK